MLAERVHDALHWPRGIDLPTASGKTACLDIAVFTLALNVDDSGRAQLPRRVFFVVDRRIVVDAAHQRALLLAEKLSRSDDRVVRMVAERLRRLSGGGDPLCVSRQRGGILRDDAWTLDPTQAAVVTGTVDQIGSRLLFRGYGPGRLSQSIHAALIANDSLVLLDEAHCARPFLQTACHVERYAGAGWCDYPVGRPLQFVVLSATLPREVAATDRFPPEKTAALDHPALRKRVEVNKVARLIVASKSPARPRKGERGIGGPVGAAANDPLVQHAADLTVKFACDGGLRRIAVMVNRVATAAAIYEQLLAETRRDDVPLDADCVLLTGRMRPKDRDEVVRRWEPDLKAGADAQLTSPVVLVTTQCLEVGADFDFDALITECASLDALRQRFGRLNRLGAFKHTEAAILHRRPSSKRLDPDPIYGTAMDATWAWMHDHADRGRFDFGIGALQPILPGDPTDLELLAPAPDAPTLMPAHLDLLCQTAPRPNPDPDVSLYLHGAGRGVAEARLVFRADLADEGTETDWLDTIALVPPVAAEMLAVPLDKARRWLAGEDLRGKLDNTGDVEGQVADDDASPTQPARFILWRGRARSAYSTDPRDVCPDDVVVVPADPAGAARLGHYFTPPDPSAPLDVAECVYPTARGFSILRLTQPVVDHWPSLLPLTDLLRWAESEDRDNSELSLLLEAIQGAGDEAPQPAPDWLRNAAHSCQQPRAVQNHPLGGVILIGRRLDDGTTRVHDEFADDDDTASEADQPVSLVRHTADVAGHARDFATRLVPTLTDQIVIAARLHDAGKADERFQAYLRNDPFGSGVDSTLLAKSEHVPHAPGARRRLREQIGLPDGFRHEMLSVQLSERCDALPAEQHLCDLILHLIASHHGHARPFAPVCDDADPPSVEVELEGLSLRIPADDRPSHPPHRLDSGVPDRFWRLTRTYGWWGLAYLEALVRLADWRASKEKGRSTHESSVVQRHQWQEAAL
jgi:CRISPR-associated endonuclease/helicase Cas3